MDCRRLVATCSHFHCNFHWQPLLQGYVWAELVACYLYCKVFVNKMTSLHHLFRQTHSHNSSYSVHVVRMIFLNKLVQTQGDSHSVRVEFLSDHHLADLM